MTQILSKLIIFIPQLENDTKKNKTHHENTPI